jgi:hypothetical protein
MLLASKYRGNNNGDLSITKGDAAKNGIGSWEWSSGLELLQAAGLIEKTRQGKILEGAGVCTLYRLTWRDLDPSDKYDIPIGISRPPSHEWAQWKTPNDWEETIRKSKRKAQGKPQQSQPAEALERIAQLRERNSPVPTGVPSQSTRVDGVQDTTVYTDGP